MPPRRIVILRHGEKQDPFQLCSIGVQRSLALTTTYLGKGAADSLFDPKEPPAAFLAITLHTVELASPSAQSWGLPLTVYSAVPITDDELGSSDDVLDARTVQAANDVMTNVLWENKTVVMVWEHKRIAHPDSKVTLRALLGLDKCDDPAPDTWHGANYDYFWIVDFGGAKPTFKKQRQIFKDEPCLPQNHWGEAYAFAPGSGCES